MSHEILKKGITAEKGRGARTRYSVAPAMRVSAATEPASQIYEVKSVEPFLQITSVDTHRSG